MPRYSILSVVQRLDGGQYPPSGIRVYFLRVIDDVGDGRGGDTSPIRDMADGGDSRGGEPRLLLMWDESLHDNRLAVCHIRSFARQNGCQSAFLTRVSAYDAGSNKLA